MDHDIEQMLEHFRIRQVLERYCRGVDRLDAEILDSVYWPEATDDHGLYKGPGIGFAAWLIPQYRDGYEATLHCIAQANIEVRGQLAAGDTYFIAYQRARRSGLVELETALGRYVDRFEKRGDEWRIIARTVVMEHFQLNSDIQPPPFSLEDFARGGRGDRTDLSYHMFAQS